MPSCLSSTTYQRDWRQDNLVDGADSGSKNSKYLVNIDRQADKGWHDVCVDCGHALDQLAHPVLDGVDRSLWTTPFSDGWKQTIVIKVHCCWPLLESVYPPLNVIQCIHSVAEEIGFVTRIIWQSDHKMRSLAYFLLSLWRPRFVYSLGSRYSTSSGVLASYKYNQLRVVHRSCLGAVSECNSSVVLPGWWARAYWWWYHYVSKPENAPLSNKQM